MTVYCFGKLWGITKVPRLPEVASTGWWGYNLRRGVLFVGP